MRVLHGLFLSWIALATPAYSQDEPPEPAGVAPVAVPESPRAQQPRGPLLGLLPGRSLEMGTSPLRLQGDIDAQDGVDGELQLKYEDFRISFPAGQSVRISATSFAMDPRLRILSPDRARILADDEDSGRGTNARLTFTPPDAGVYVVRVLGTYRGMNGPYWLTVEPALPLPDPMPADGGAGSETTHWSEFSGALTTQDAQIDGVYFDDFRLSVAAGQEVFVRLDSADFDPVVQIYPAANREGDYVMADDDSGPGRNSLLIFQRPEAGEYVIRVTTFSSAVPTGTYKLRIGR
jgi:hypothetical protein